MLLLPLQKFESICRDLGGLDLVALAYRIQGARITSQRSGTKEIIVCRRNGFRFVPGSRAAVGERRMLTVTRQQIHAGNVIARNQPLNFIQHCRGIKWAQLWLQSLSLKPHCMTVGLARLRSARLSHVSMRAAAEWHELVYVETHGVSDADNHFEVRLRARNLTSLLHQLQVAASI